MHTKHSICIWAVLLIILTTASITIAELEVTTEENHHPTFTSQTIIPTKLDVITQLLHQTNTNSHLLPLRFQLIFNTRHITKSAPHQLLLSLSNTEPSISQQTHNTSTKTLIRTIPPLIQNQLHQTLSTPQKLLLAFSNLTEPFPYLTSHITKTTKKPIKISDPLTHNITHQIQSSPQKCELTKSTYLYITYNTIIGHPASNKTFTITLHNNQTIPLTITNLSTNISWITWNDTPFVIPGKNHTDTYFTMNVPTNQQPDTYQSELIINTTELGQIIEDFYFTINPDPNSDIYGPTITITTITPTYPKLTDTITITAHVTDLSGVNTQSVNLNYSHNAGVTYHTQPMQHNTGATYTTTIGPFSYGHTHIYGAINATDLYHNTNTYYFSIPLNYVRNHLTANRRSPHIDGINTPNDHWHLHPLTYQEYTENNNLLTYQGNTTINTGYSWNDTQLSSFIAVPKTLNINDTTTSITWYFDSYNDFYLYPNLDDATQLTLQINTLSTLDLTYNTTWAHDTNGNQILSNYTTNATHYLFEWTKPFGTQEPALDFFNRTKTTILINISTPTTQRYLLWPTADTLTHLSDITTHIGIQDANAPRKWTDLSLTNTLNITLKQPNINQPYALGTSIPFNVSITDSNNILQTGSNTTIAAILTGPQNEYHSITLQPNGSYYTTEYVIQNSSTGIWTLTLTAQDQYTNHGHLTTYLYLLKPFFVNTYLQSEGYALGDIIHFSTSVVQPPNKYLTDSDINLTITIHDSTNTTVYGPLLLSSQPSGLFELFTHDLDTTMLGLGSYTATFTAEDTHGYKRNDTITFNIINNYTTTLTTDQNIYHRDHNVTINGNAQFTNGTGVPNTPIQCKITVKNYSRILTTQTDTLGDFILIFDPYAYEAGNYTIEIEINYKGLIHTQTTAFIIEGLFLQPTTANIEMIANTTQKLTYTLYNLGEIPLQNLTITPIDHNTSDTITLQTNTTNMDTTLNPDTTTTFTIDIHVTISNPTTETFIIQVNTPDGYSENSTLTVTIFPDTPILYITPPNIQVGIHPNNSTIQTLQLYNIGYGALTNITITQPTLPWVFIPTDTHIDSIPSQQHQTIDIHIAAYNITLGTYTDHIFISSDNHPTKQVNLTIHVTNQQTGNLHVHVTDILGNNLSNVTVYLVNHDTYQEYEQTTNTNGITLFSTIPEGRYTYEVTAQNDSYHPDIGTINVQPLITTEIEIILYIDFIDYTWEIYPTPIQDRYIINLNLTFETDIPVPILVPYPPQIICSLQPGETITETITLFNMGLISLYDITLTTSNFGPDIQIEFPFNEYIPEIKAKQSVDIPVKITLADNALNCTYHTGKISAKGTFIHFIGNIPVQSTAGTSIPVIIRTPFGNCQQDPQIPGLPNLCFYLGLPFFNEIYHGIPFDIDGYSYSTGYMNEAGVVWILDYNFCNAPSAHIQTDTLFATNIHNKDILLTNKSIGFSKDFSLLPYKDILSFGFSVFNDFDSIWYGTWQSTLGVKEVNKIRLKPTQTAYLDLNEIGTGVGFSLIDLNFVGGMILTLYETGQLENKTKCLAMSPILGVKFGINCLPDIYPPYYEITWPDWILDFDGRNGFPDWKPFNIDINIPPIPPPSPIPPIDPPTPPEIIPPLITKNIHEIIKLSISQELTLERDAFTAGLSIYNRMKDTQITDININLTITKNNTPANHLFFIKNPRLTGINNIQGSGILNPLHEAIIQWLIIPKEGAGGTNPTGQTYNISATITYTVNGQTYSLSTQEATFIVKPQPKLRLDYYIPSEVTANAPFKLAVQVTNEGYGIARDVQIESAQPVIYYNPSGLLINFKILETTVQGQNHSNTLKLNFGDITPNETAFGCWKMVSTLDGTFTEFTGTYTHTNALGGHDTSLISSIHTHIILREIDSGNITYDLLVDSDLDGIPDEVINALYGTGTPVQEVTYTIIMPPTAPHPIMTIQTQKISGQWIYTSIDDPNNNTYPILTIIRSDGKILPRPNYWMRNGRILLVDDPLEIYNLTYDYPPTINDTTPSIAYAGHPHQFTATLIDYDGIHTARIEYWYTNTTHQNLSMHHTHNNTWITNLTINNTLQTLHYQIYTNDTHNNWNQTTITNISVYDITPPHIHSLQATPPYQNIGGHVNITTNITDNIEIKSVHLIITPPAVLPNEKPTNKNEENTPNQTTINISITENHTQNLYYHNTTYQIPGQYTYYIWTNDTSGNQNTSATHTFTINNQPPEPPHTPSPPNNAQHIPLTPTLTWQCTDPDMHTLTYDIYLEANDPTPDVLIADNHPFKTYTPDPLNHETMYYWQIIATDEYGAATPGPIWSFTTIDAPNQPPTDPTITGKTQIKVNTPQDYTIISTDNQNDNVSYYIDWGDGSNTGWTPLQSSGPPGITKTHTWTTKDDFTISAKTKDEHGAESNWSLLPISVPVNQKQTNPSIEYYLELRDYFKNL